MHASLVEKDTREDVLLIKDTRSKEDMHLFKDNRTKATTGSSVSSLYPLKDIEGNGQESGFFVFPDLSVRMEGTYRLKFCLYEMVGKDVHFCAHVISDPLVVFSAKKFPGMEESTVLSQYFADQGLKLRIRKEVRPKKRTRGEYIGIEPKSQSPAADSQEDEDSAAVAGLPTNSKRRASGTRSVESRRATTPHLDGKNTADGPTNSAQALSQKNRPWRSPLPEHLEAPAQRPRQVQEPYAQSRPPPYFDESLQVARRHSATNKAAEGVSQLDLNGGPRSEEEYHARAQEAHLFREREYAAQAARAGTLGPYRGGSGSATPRTAVPPGHYPSGSPSTPFARNPDHPSHAVRVRAGEPIDPKSAELYDDYPEELRRSSFAGPHRHPMYDPRLGRHPRDPHRGAPYPPDGIPADGPYAYPPYPGYPGRPRSTDYGPYPGEYYRAGPHPYDRQDHLMRSADDLSPHYPPYPYHLHRDLYDPRLFDDYGYPRFRPGSQADPYAGYPYRYPPLHGKYPPHDGLGPVSPYTMAEVDVIAMGKHPYPYLPHEPGTPYSRQGPGAAGYPPASGDPLGRPGRDELDAPYERDLRDPRDPRDPREARDARELREPRDSRDPREARDPRDPRVASPPRPQDYSLAHYPHPLARGAYGPPGESPYGPGRDREEDLRQRPVALGHPGYPPYTSPHASHPGSGAAAAGAYARESPSSYPYRPHAMEGVLPRSSSMDHGLDGHPSFGHGRSASSSNLPRAGHPPTSAAATSSASSSVGEMALPLTRRASHAYGSESQAEHDRVGAPEGRENASSYAATHPGPRRSDPTPYGAAGRSIDSEYGVLLPGYGLRGAHAHAAAVAAASYYHGHAPPGYPGGAYPPHFPEHPSAHGHTSHQGLGSKQDDKTAMSHPGATTTSQSAASVSLGSQPNSMSAQAAPEHQKVSAA
ncbi:hypothetical protein EC991_007386 [Linnemannia zychae]|nr:hypothetical protein EC991_007386 [Linnemannia zychae]